MEVCDNGLAVLTIDKPKALNACDIAMVAAIRRAIALWKDDSAVCAVLLKGSGGKAFCSGADVKGMREALVADAATELPKEQVYQEYNLIFEMRQLQKPTLALLDGVTMGFGLGLACSTRFRIATEKSRLAMPENNIGLFPDVGFAYLATKMPTAVGRLLALTGTHLLGAGDALESGLATHHITIDKLPRLLAALQAADLASKAESAIRSCIEGLAESPAPGMLAANGALLARLAAAKSLSDAYAALDAEAGEAESWVSELKLGTSKGSPFSQAVICRLIAAAEAEADMPEPGRLAVALERDFATACRMAYRPDFGEGVRAVLVDKGSTAVWQPATPLEVLQEEVEAAIAPLPKEQRWLGLLDSV